jgi:hypothetical protein
MVVEGRCAAEGNGLVRKGRRKRHRKRADDVLVRWFVVDRE